MRTRSGGEVPARFGDEWAHRFFKEFLRGERSLGQIFLQLRLQFLEEHRDLNAARGVVVDAIFERRFKIGRAHVCLPCGALEGDRQSHRELHVLNQPVVDLRSDGSLVVAA